jgi:hypothetical protein
LKLFANGVCKLGATESFGRTERNWRGKGEGRCFKVACEDIYFVYWYIAREVLGQR